MEHLLDVYFSNFYAVTSFGGHLKLSANEVWKYGDHSFSQNKFYFITKGSCTINIEGKNYVANAGDWFFIPAHTVHRYSNHTEAAFCKYWMHFDIYPNNDIFNLLKLPFFVKVKKGSPVYTLFRKYVKLNTSTELLDKISVRSILLQLIAEYIRIAHPNGISIKSKQKETIDDVLRYINHNITQSFSINDLAKEFHFHPNHFIRFFKKETGQTPAHYITSKKMELVKHYLEYSNLSVSEIMEKMCETDMPAFSKQFKKFYSFSPREYRKLYINNSQDNPPLVK